MALIRKMAALGTAMAVAAVLFGAFAASASAQNPPYSAYGTGLEAGAVVEAWIGDTACGEAEVDTEGQWLIQVQNEGDCAPIDGDEISFTIDGEATNETVVYSAGGRPDDVANGIDLTLAEGDGTPAPAPAPSDTGNAGLLGSTGTSMALVLALGVFAAALVAGGRTAAAPKVS